MQDKWYADKRDLIKWGVLLRLAEIFDAKRVLQVAFYRPNEFGKLDIDGQQYDIPAEVIAHFRNLQTIASMGSRVRVTVFDPPFRDRPAHLKSVLALLPAFAQERCIVFLDPDTGLESATPSLEHVLAAEARVIWSGMKVGDVFAFYQHQTNRNGQPWIEPKQRQLADALGVSIDGLKIAKAPDIAQDVAFFYTQRT